MKTLPYMAKELAGVTEVRTLKWGDYSGLSKKRETEGQGVRKSCEDGSRRGGRLLLSEDKEPRLRSRSARSQEEGSLSSFPELPEGTQPRPCFPLRPRLRFLNSRAVSQ